jgi:hypothetical protein
MSTTTAHDYYERGVRAGLEATPVTSLKLGTWQRRAWDRGYMDGTEELARRGAAPRASIVAPVDLDRWPQAAREHYARLLADINAEKKPHRRARLQKAVLRMHKRHHITTT